MSAGVVPNTPICQRTRSQITLNIDNPFAYVDTRKSRRKPVQKSDGNQGILPEINTVSKGKNRRVVKRITKTIAGSKAPTTQVGAKSDTMEGDGIIHKHMSGSPSNTINNAGTPARQGEHGFSMQTNYQVNMEHAMTQFHPEGVPSSSNHLGSPSFPASYTYPQQQYQHSTQQQQQQMQLIHKQVHVQQQQQLQEQQKQ